MDVYQFDLDLKAAGGFNCWEVLKHQQSTGPNTNGLWLNGCNQSGSQVSANTCDVISNGSNPNGTPTYRQNTPICFHERQAAVST